MVTRRKSASPNLRPPERANIENLRKQAKARLTELKYVRPDASLTDAQLQIARENGFSSWRALKAAFDRQDGRMSFQVTVRAVNAIYSGVWNTEAGEWQGTFTHHGRDAALALRLMQYMQHDAFTTRQAVAHIR